MPPVSNNTTASALAKQLEAGEVTSVALVEHYLGNIQASDDTAVFITLTAGQALEAARNSDGRRARGAAISPWDGIPIVWKDLFDIKGTSTTAGSRVYANAPAPDKHADVVEACERLGLISLGKTNLSEFAYSGLGLNPHFGTPVNPFSRDEPRAPGGSSAGSAVAVAGGLAPIAIGTDTAGSVRVPASFCGIAGFKSSQSRYSMGGVFSLSASLDSLGIFAHSVEDLIAVDGLMRGDVPFILAPIAPREIEIVIPETVVFDGIEADVLACFEKTTSALEAAGFTLNRSPFPIFQQISDLFAQHGTLAVAEAATLHKELLESNDAALMDRRVRDRMLTAHQFTAQDYIKLQWERERLQQSLIDELGNRLMLFPTVAFTAPSIAALEADDDLFARTNLMALRNTMLGNYLDMPGVSLPIGNDGNDLPIGILLSGPTGQDDRVLAAALSISESIRITATDGSN